MPASTSVVAWSFEAIGAPWRIDVTPGPEGAGARAEDRLAIDERIERFDRDWSRFRTDSLVSTIAREGGNHTLPAEAADLFALYRGLYTASAGRISPLVARSLDQLGYDANYRLTPAGDPIAAPDWESSIALHTGAAGEVTLDAPTPVSLDIGAAGKGLLVDLVGAILAERGAAATIVDASGDLRAWGETSIRVGLENPANTELVVGVVEVRPGRSLAASAPQRRQWGPELHHLIDATTGRPTAGDIIATWAVAETAMLADGIATALFVTEPEALTDRFAVDWVRMHADGRLTSSPGWEGELFA